MNNLEISLLITGIGMGLVFAAILLLWGLMEILVRATQIRMKPNKITVDANREQIEAISSVDNDERKSKRRAAAVAVATALAIQQTIPTSIPVTQTTNLSAWQTIKRSAQLNKQINKFNRVARKTLR